MSAAMTFRLYFTSRRGASVCRYLTADEVPAALKALRCEAELRLGDEVVGGVTDIDYAADRRERWNWWYDATIVDGLRTEMN